MSPAALAPGDVRDSPGPAGVFTSVLGGLLGAVVSKVERKVVQWTQKLDGIAAGATDGAGPAALVDEGLDAVAEGGSTAVAAGAEAMKAGLHGQNPVWAAIKEAWSSGTPAVKAAIVAAAVSAILLLALSPVVLIVYLLSWLITAAIERVRRRKT